MILALDSSASIGSIALVDQDKIIAQLSVETPRGRGGALFSALEEILRGGREVSRVVAGTGPGSYNGIRAALAVAWGISSARRIPFAGVSSLLGLAEGDYNAAGDARRGQFYFARVSNGRFVVPPSLFERNQFLRKIEEEGRDRLFVPAPIDFLPEAVVCTPDAARLARVVEESAFDSGNLPEPIYLKPAHITTPSGVVMR